MRREKEVNQEALQPNVSDDKSQESTPPLMQGEKKLQGTCSLNTPTTIQKPCNIKL